MKAQNLLEITAVTIITLIASLFNYASAQNTYAVNHTAKSTAPLHTQEMFYADDSAPFKAAVFPRLNGNIAVHVQKNPAAVVKVTIYNSKGRFIRQEKLKGHALISKEYVLENFPKDTYIFKIKSRGSVYTKEVCIH